MSFTVKSAIGRSDVPLYLYTTGGRKVVNIGWRTLWQAPNSSSPDSFIALNLSNPSGVIGFSINCVFGSEFVGTTLTIQGLVNNAIALSSPVTVTGTGPISVFYFRLYNARPGPVSYRGPFQWRLWDGYKVVATFGTATFLELYAIVPPPATLWGAFGVSVNLLRAYTPNWNAVVQNWSLADFHHYTAEIIFAGSFKYDNLFGMSRFTFGLGGTYKLDQYFAELEGGLPSKINCYDMAGIMQVSLSLFPNYNQVQWNFMQPFGFINTTTLKGYGPCNNPFWGNSSFYNNPIAPVNYVPSQLRSAFGNHAFISSPTNSGIRILDSTSGPHTGTEDLTTYIMDAIDHVTDYYTKFPGYGPGTPANISPAHSGVTSIINLPAVTLMLVAPAISAEGISTATSSEEKAALSVASGSLEEAKVSHAEAKSGPDPVDDTMERAKVDDADPPRLARIDPPILKPHLEKSLESKLTSESVEPGVNGSYVYWRFGTEFRAVELNATILKSHEAAVAAMKAMLQTIQAPLDIVLARKLRLGQRSLSGVGGTGLIFFVRGNVFVRLEGLGSSEELGKIATDLDGFLRQREGDSKRVPGPSVPVPELPQRKVTVGTTFKVSVNVTDVGYMAAVSDASIVQLIEVEEKRATFVFHANSLGNVDVRLVFAHPDTLQVATAVVHVEVVKASREQ